MENVDDKIRASRTERYACQSVARLALPNERVAKCLRGRTGDHVSVHSHRKTGKAFYGGLMVCGSVWTCPVCAAKISEKRREELEHAFTIHKANGGKIAMLTLTFSHSKFDKLADLINKFGQATQKFMSGYSFNKIRQEMGLIGRVRVYEVTYGDNGFHPHAHIALFYENDVELMDIRIKMFYLWQKACEKSGLSTDITHGLDLQSGDDASSYFTKHGTWSMEQELTKAHIKKAKNGGMSPFDFLREVVQNGDMEYLALFKEYAKCFKGKRQLQWSQGLKKKFILDDKSDEDLAKEKVEEADILGLLDYKDWKIILKYDLRAKLLDNVEKYGFELGLHRTKKESSWLEDSQNIDEI